LYGGFGGALALSSASGMTKLEGNLCVVTWGRDARGGVGNLVLVCVPNGNRLDTEVSLRCNILETFALAFAIYG